MCCGFRLAATNDSLGGLCRRGDAYRGGGGGGRVRFDFIVDGVIIRI